MDTSELKSFSASGLMGAPVKGLNDTTLVLDLGEGRELRVPASPGMMQERVPPVLGDYFVQKGGEGAGFVVPRQMFEALFGTEHQAAEGSTPETGPVPTDALGMTSESLEAKVKEAEKDPQEAQDEANAASAMGEDDTIGSADAELGAAHEPAASEAGQPDPVIEQPHARKRRS